MHTPWHAISLFLLLFAAVMLIVGQSGVTLCVIALVAILQCLVRVADRLHSHVLQLEEALVAAQDHPDFLQTRTFEALILDPAGKR
ncbi:hypothetical protein [Deinococcus ficus]|uniref:Uncharacterized protein n=1 Tax=Deinococcus ficus TaxID=317577 RepID=A0A221T2Z5_9DEIO|nr:hypothetical protein [Deinococcus ficus]ASN83297.1 hypothetical protein DFI_19050 [Deinococcus ficus]